jgi:hypothetical protein
MGKKKRLKLEGLKVESFVTSLNDNDKKMINGGLEGGSPVWLCDPDSITCEERCTVECSGDCYSEGDCH